MVRGYTSHMRGVVLGVAAACICFAPISVAAQVLKSTGGVALLPAGPTESTVSRPVVLSGAVGSGRDLFLADPDTYAPRFDRQRQVFRSRYFLRSGIGYVERGYAKPRRPRGRRSPSNRIGPGAGTRAANPAGSTGTTERAHRHRPEPLAMPAGPQKTFYVIPRCYAGDVLPLADQLPDDCHLADLRMLLSRGQP